MKVWVCQPDSPPNMRISLEFNANEPVVSQGVQSSALFVISKETQCNSALSRLSISIEPSGYSLLESLPPITYKNLSSMITLEWQCQEVLIFGPSIHSSHAMS